MDRSIASRLFQVLVALATVAMLSGCLPGQFPIPPDRSAPPAPSKKGVSGASPYYHGAQAPLVTVDAGD